MQPPHEQPDGSSGPANHFRSSSFGGGGPSSVGASCSALVAKSKPAEWSLASDAVVAEWSRPFEWDALVETINQDVFGNTGFRLHQREAINAVLSKRDVVVLMPTGAGECWGRHTKRMLSDGRMRVCLPC